MKQGDPIVVKIAATNNLGTSDFLEVSGVEIQTVPLAPPAVQEGEQTNESQIHVVWSLITDEPGNGGAPILSYQLDWDNGTNQMIW